MKPEVGRRHNACGIRAPDESRTPDRRKPETRAPDASREMPGDRTGRRVQAPGASQKPGLRKSQRRDSRRKPAVQPKASWRKSGRRKPEAQPKAS